MESCLLNQEQKKQIERVKIELSDSLIPFIDYSLVLCIAHNLHIIDGC